MILLWFGQIFTFLPVFPTHERTKQCVGRVIVCKTGFFFFLDKSVNETAKYY